MYKVEGISKVFWQYSKTDFKYTDFNDLIKQLSEKIHEYLGHDYADISEQNIVALSCSAYADMCASMLVPRHLTENMFKTIYGDPIIELVLGKDNRSINERIICGVLGAFRLTQIYTEDKQCLVDFGQEHS